MNRIDPFSLGPVTNGDKWLQMVTNVDRRQQMAKMAANVRKYATIDDKHPKLTTNGEKR